MSNIDSDLPATSQDIQAPTATSAANTEHKLITLLKKIGLKDDQILNIFVYLQPLVDEHIQKIIMETLTETDLRAFEIVAKQNEFDDEQKTQMLEEGYKKKTGKDLALEVDKFYDLVADAIQEAMDKTIAIADQVKDLPEDQKEAEAQKLVQKFIEDKFSQIS